MILIAKATLTTKGFFLAFAIEKVCSYARQIGMRSENALCPIDIYDIWSNRLRYTLQEEYWSGNSFTMVVYEEIVKKLNQNFQYKA